MDKAQIKEIVDKEIANTSLFLVDVILRPGNIILVEVDNDEGVGIDECAALSRAIESHFDRDVEDFELEVGSAGLTSAFKIPRQYQKNIGNEVEVLTKNGLKLFGILNSCDDTQFSVLIFKKEKVEGAKRPVVVEEEVKFFYEEVKHTKYQIRIK